ncbi:F-box protein PP2-A13 [Nicotiana sylvestris]|uniref:F-box protein PP2-A13-like n=1 Tax=Nicotiana sylvestris TaxID=4096 RepID=A0A1U7VNH0_NICSY|nr:PREDICTED: F-box protein PP2-A13-like [Nicotiana sylvestris]
MGAGFSSLEDREKLASDGSSKPGLEDLPESCIALVLTHLDPIEICKFASLNTTFRQASLTDYVWETKLPENFQFLVENLWDEDSCSDSLTKKEIFARLCRPNHFGSSNKAFWLEKNRGVCVCISWKDMKITGIEDRRYWSHISSDESRFGTVAFLKQIWWVEVEGNLEFEFPVGNYSLFFRLQLGKNSRKILGRRICNVEQVHGWNIKPVQFKLSSSNGQHATAQYFLNEPGKWIQYHVGDFVVENSTMPTKLNFSMAQIDCTHTKGGLSLDSVLILPAEIGSRKVG